MVVTDVHPGSPAAGAGFQVGDTVVRVNGTAAVAEALTRLQTTLSPGTRVRFTLRRRGPSRTVQITAQPRPADEVLSVLSPQVRLRLDSAHAVFLEHLDSARVAPGLSAFRYALEGATVRALVWRSDQTSIARAGVQDERTYVVQTSPTPWVSTGLDPIVELPDPAFAPPFPSLLVQDPRSQELLLRLRELEGSMREAQLEEARQDRELARQQGQLSRAVEDQLLRERRRLLDEIRSEAELVKREMQRLAEVELARVASQLRASRMRVREVTGTVSVEEAEGLERPLARYLIGQDRIAGARLTPLNRELGSYFGVGQGLLVVEVAAGTPAADAGMLPGDVVVRAQGRETATLEGLRRELARGGGYSAALLTVVRKGQRLELALPR